MDQLPPIAADARVLLERQRAAFAVEPFPTLVERQAHLRTLEAVVKSHQRRICDAVAADFGNRSRTETTLAEVIPTISATRYARARLPGWMRRRRRAVGMNSQPASNWVEYHPVGVVGVISPWNYPVYLTLGPLVDILAAGNRCLIKPSELTPATSALLAELIGGAFAPEHVAVVQGDAGVARAFSTLPFDHLLFTGSTSVGREVMRAATENLTPVTLELGGKSPVILADDYAVEAAAKSVATGKFFNAGQTCVAPDYVLAPAGRAEQFAALVIAEAEAMYPTLTGNPDYTAIVSDRHFERLTGLVAEAEQAGARVLRHRDTSRDNVRRFPPTVVLDAPPDGRLMRDEIFGPVLPVVRTGSTEEAIRFVQARPRPLALYVFTKNAETERHVLDRTVAGGVTINGTMMHVGQEDLPFGGIGPSGMGAYHGHEGFLRFSHARAVHKPGFFSGFEFLRPPHGRKTRLALKALAGKDAAI